MKENERLKHDKKQSRRSINFMGRSAYATTISLSTLKGGQTSKNKESPMSLDSNNKLSVFHDSNSSDKMIMDRIGYGKLKGI